ncbi:MAG: luciferase-like monooxygenase [Solirubrobacterales bacterium]|jgi:alkanesulfonate monooxygenase SsuD/methylene tetrahydromethanopterin reductase-like flavin-dependent oxidoreductase (luciferase family)|nr:luciferase-like monooxygenase [Solirubrobacterales bacterium]
MKFSMIFEAQMTDVRDEHQVLRDCVEQAVFAEEMGFDRIWSVEHHALVNYAHLSASEIFLAYVAAKTEKIRIGHGVICLPFGFSHPVRVAERTAMLDILSNGRLDVGAGRGATMTETSLYGVDVDKTYLEMEESLKIVSAIWQSDKFSWDSDLIKITPPEGSDGFSIVPKPQQQPHPPLFMACTHKDTLRLAAEWGVGALVLGYGGPTEMKELLDFYKGFIDQRDGEKLVSPGVTNDWFGALCPTVTLDDRDEAIRVGLRGQKFFAQSIAHYYGGGPIPEGIVDDSIENLRAGLDDAAGQFVAKLHEMEIPIDPGVTAGYNPDQAYGNADDAIAYVQALKDAGVDEVMCCIQMGTIGQEHCMETIKQWGEKVIPHFRELEGAAVATAGAEA